MMSNFDLNAWYNIDNKNSVPIDFFNEKVIDTDVNDTKFKEKIKQAEDENNRLIMSQLKENEKQKRTLKPRLIICILALCFLQLIFLNVIIGIVVISCVCHQEGIWFIGQMNLDILNSVSSLLKYFISATIVELLAMIYFIVSNIFGDDIFNIIMGKKNKTQKNN